MYIDKLNEIGKDHLIMDSGNETLRIYDELYPAAIKEYFDKENIKYSIYLYPTYTTDCAEADYWCCVSWFEGEKIESYGFNWMSKYRKQALKTFENTMQSKGGQF